MPPHYHIAAGLDVHKTFYQVSIVSDINDTIERNRFKRTFPELLELRAWLLSHHVEVAACESTSDYWILPYDLLSPHIRFIVGNACDMKANYHKKTDKLDADHIAKLALNNLVTPSRILPRGFREIRSHSRLRYKLVEYRTQIKNQIHHIFDSALFRLSTAFSDMFGKTGLRVINHILNGSSIDTIISCLPPKMHKKEEFLRDILGQTLSPSALLRLSSCVRILEELNTEIEFLTLECITYMEEHMSREFRILQSVPGIGKIAAFTILAEIGDIHAFPTKEQLASWSGLVQRVYQSAGKTYTGSITKRGPAILRWILVEAAQACSRTKKNALKTFFEAKKATIGGRKAIVATARKMLTIIWHLLMNNEVYDDGIYHEIKMKKTVHVRIPREVSLEGMLKILREANVVLKENTRNDDGGGVGE